MLTSTSKGSRLRREISVTMGTSMSRTSCRRIATILWISGSLVRVDFVAVMPILRQIGNAGCTGLWYEGHFLARTHTRTFSSKALPW